jgi:ATP-dependent helicase HrpB
LSFDPFQIDLPVTKIIGNVRETLKANNTLVVGAPPGAGKSTLLPLSLLNEEWLGNKKIIMLEPRRLAARAIASRMASLLEETTGETVGYRIRFENSISNKTRIEVVTEGILTRMLHNDNALENVALVIFDEFHERNLHADLALALCRDAQQVLRPDLRIMIMSATLNMPLLAELLDAPIIESQGKQFPVKIVHVEDADSLLLPELTAHTIIKATKDHHGDVLAFLPGEGEIKKCEEILKGALTSFSIHPLYGQMPQNEQLAAILPNKHGIRKIVLATSIAETSLTIEGVRIVVDSGFARTSRFDPRSGLTKLETVRITKDSADQRAGRAGRLSEGVCYRMWTRATHERLSEHRVPEILEADLTAMILDLYVWGITKIEDLSWLTLPPKASVSQALDTLHFLGALENNKITFHGKEIHALACHPRLAHMLIIAKEHGLASLAADVAAVLEERDPLGREMGIDINLRIEALRRSRQNRLKQGKFSRIEKVAASYRKLLHCDESNDPFDPYNTGLLVAAAYPERIACSRPGNNAQFQLANGKYAVVGHKDDLSHEQWLAVANMDLREGLGKIFLAAPLNPKDLISMVRETDNISWDSRKGGLIATREMRIGSIVLQSKPLQAPDQQAVMNVILKAIENEGESLLNFDENFIQLQNRILSLKLWNSHENWPDVTTSNLLSGSKLWLQPYLQNVKKPEDLRKINISDALFHSLDFAKQNQLNELAPAKIIVPSGSVLKLQYFANGAPPVLAVRLQEMFGLSDTPIINKGKTSLVLHLLSPGYKPVQITSDLKSFWNNMYFEVRKELKRRYPKHSWPEDPWTAQAIAKGRSSK